MDVGAQPVARIRGLALSPKAFQRLAFANAAMLVLIVATGATVRLTGSGLGCEHWPGCAPHHFEPKSFHSYIEFSNRVIAFFTILVTLVTWIFAAGRRRAVGGSARAERDVRDGCRAASGQRRRAAALVVPAGGLLARARDGRVRHLVRAAARVARAPQGAAGARCVPTARAPLRSDGDRRDAVPHASAVVARARACH